MSIPIVFDKPKPKLYKIERECVPTGSIKVIPPDKWSYIFTCPKCGNHVYDLVHIPSRWFCESDRLLICANCLHAIRRIDVQPAPMKGGGW